MDRVELSRRSSSSPTSIEHDGGSGPDGRRSRDPYRLEEHNRSGPRRLDGRGAPPGPVVMRRERRVRQLSVVGSAVEVVRPANIYRKLGAAGREDLALLNRVL